MRSEDGFAAGGTGEPGETGADTFGPVFLTESAPYVELLEKEVGSATVVAAAGASAEPVPTSVGTAKTEEKALSAEGKTRRCGGTAIDGGDGGRNTSDKKPEGAERSSILIRGRCV